MIHALPPDQHYYRVTTLGRRWRDVLSGKGSLYLSATGNRYNTVLQQAAYVCDDLRVAVTELAYYAARDWQDRLGNHHLLPVPGPLQGDFVLWRFTLQQPTYVVDVENAAGVPWQLPPSPCSIQGGTTRPRKRWRTTRLPGRSTDTLPPHPGLRVPAVRSRNGPMAQEVNYVLYKIASSPRGHLVGRWRLRIEFLDLNGSSVGAGSPRIDWSRPRFQLLVSPGSAPTAPLPAPYVLGNWSLIQINPV
jgi:hypothetical protein